jgi:hypothetical protein
MASVSILKKPIYVDFDRRRQIVFNLNTEILIRQQGAGESSLWSTIGERENPKTGAVERMLDVNLENLRLYLWATLQPDAASHDEQLTLEDVGALLTRRKWVTRAVLAITEALSQYYGDDPAGETNAPAVSA